MKDQLNRILNLHKIPKRIISIVPSQTELLFDLGLDEEVVGITKFCVHPNIWLKTKQKVGGTKKIQINLVKELKPDIIFANKEENTKEDIEILQTFCPVWMSDISSFDDALEMIDSIGKIVDRESKASEIIAQLHESKRHFQSHLIRKIPTLYFIWKSPYMVAGCDTFINDMMKIAGFENVIQSNRYPIIEPAEILKLNPKLIFLSSEPFPFKQNDIEELAKMLPDSKIMLVDGELFSWYGSRMLQSFDYFSALHEQIH